MRKIIIDTDTASDDAVAIIMALRANEIKVEAITTVAGNVPIDTATKNALVSIQMADTYQPPVYIGESKPLSRDLVTSKNFHGEDGMGNMNLDDPQINPQEMGAVDAIINIVKNNPNEIELITIGPLTNIAQACIKAPEIMKNIKDIFVMGGNGLGPGNITEYAEFNFFVDAEAVQVILDLGLNPYFLGWDVSLRDSYINESDINSINNSNSESAKFCVRANQSIIELNQNWFNKTGFVLPDPAILAVALYPEIALESYEAFSYMITEGEKYGQHIIEFDKKPNSRFCKLMDEQSFKKVLFKLIN